MRVYLEPSGERFLRRVIENLNCSRTDTLSDLCRRVGTQAVVDGIRKSAVILVTDGGKVQKAYTIPFYKLQVENRGEWTVEEFVKFVEERAQRKIDYLQRALINRRMGKGITYAHQL